MNEGEKGVEDMEEDELGKGGNVEFVKEKERWGCWLFTKAKERDGKAWTSKEKQKLGFFNGEREEKGEVYWEWRGERDGERGRR